MSTADIARPRFARMYLKASKSAEQRGATDQWELIDTLSLLQQVDGLPAAAAQA